MPVKAQQLELNSDKSLVYASGAPALGYHIPVNKFFPPLLEKSNYLTRRRLLDSIAREIPRKRLISFVARAGFGKTVLAAQYAKTQKASTVWYKAGLEDADPVFFLLGLFTAIKAGVSDFSCQLLDEIFEKCEIHHAELDSHVDLLLRALEKTAERRITFILDDIHNIDGAGLSVKMVKKIIGNAPLNCHFAFTSRKTLDDLSIAVRPEEQIAFTEEDLAFTFSEISDLYQDIYDVDLTPQMSESLRRSTRGWAMGLALLREDVSRNNLKNIQELDPSDNNSIVHYFQNVILNKVSEKERETLFNLSLLEDMDQSLAESALGHSLTRDLLNNLIGKVMFIRRSEKDEGALFMHPLFLSCLRTLAREKLPAAHVKRVFQNAAKFFEKKGDIIKSCEYFLAAENLKEVKRILVKHAEEVMGAGIRVRLAGLLGKLPAETVEGSPWLLLLSGVVLTNTDPLQALSSLEKSRKLFSKESSKTGELLAISELLNFSMLMDGDYERVGNLLERGKSLYARLNGSLSKISRIHVSTSLGVACLVVNNAFDEGEGRVSEALGLGRDGVGIERTIRARLFHLHHLMATGNLDSTMDGFGSLYKFRRDDRIGLLDRMLIHLSAANVLALLGEHAALKKVMLLAREEFGAEAMAKTIMEPYFYRWRIDAEVARGDLESAESLTNDALSMSGPAENPHFRAQYTQYKAIFHAMRKDRRRAIELVNETEKLRARAGGIHQIVYTLARLGAVFTILEDWPEAERRLNFAIVEAESVGKDYVTAGSFALRAYTYARMGREGEAVDDLKRFAEIMIRRGYDYCDPWLPWIMREVFQLAVRHGVHPALFRSIANKRLDISFNEQGQAVPLLKITAFGGLKLEIDGRMPVTSRDLTQIQREFMGLLICSPKFRIEQMEAQAVLWPESPADKARSKLDTLLSRLRKALKDFFPDINVEDYISLRHGIISLENLIVDSGMFHELGEKGIKALRNGKKFLADIRLNSALGLWRDPFLPGVKLNEIISTRRERIVMERKKYTLAGAKLCENDGRYKEAESLLQLLFLENPLDEDVVRCLYGLHIRRDAVAIANRVLKKYRDALLDDGFTHEEAADAAAEIIQYFIRKDASA